MYSLFDVIRNRTLRVLVQLTHYPRRIRQLVFPQSSVVCKTVLTYAVPESKMEQKPENRCPHIPLISSLHKSIVSMCKAGSRRGIGKKTYITLPFMIHYYWCDDGFYQQGFSARIQSWSGNHFKSRVSMLTSLFIKFLKE